MNGLGRKLVLVGMDAVLLTAAYLLAFWLRLGWDGATRHAGAIAQTLPVVIAISLFVHLRLGLFNAVLRYASVDTAVAVLKSIVIAVLLSSMVFFLLFRLDGIPRSIFIIYGMTSFLLVGGSRFAVRFRMNGVRANGNSKHVLLYGAGDTAELVLRGLSRSPDMRYAAVGLIDDDPIKHDQRIHGVKIHGGIDVLSRAKLNGGVDEMWICNPDLVGERLRKAYEVTGPLHIRVKILPRLEHALLGTDLGRFHEPDISDLLRRPPRSLDRERMRSWIQGRRVLITGAGGSIGRELARQVSRLEPESLALCDCSEENLFEIHGELGPRCNGMVQRPYLTNVCDEEAVDRMFREARPDVVFHAAAYKHVPLVELNPCEGILTNVRGLTVVARAAIEHQVREFVFISTDKAVRPANVMGATKRLGEKIVQVLNREGGTRFMAVRFGNVLGSSGSVVPIFQEQIRRGGPVTVTHPDMTRFFMLVSEAVELVIQAGSIGLGGEIFVLDMGAPVRIADMAKDLTRLMGKEPDRDVHIQYTGVRPGEKIHEELLLSPEDARTQFPDIWIDHEPPPHMEWPWLKRELEACFSAAWNAQAPAALRGVKKLVPRFAPLYEGTRRLLDDPAPAAPPTVTTTVRAPGETPVGAPRTAANPLPVSR